MVVSSQRRQLLLRIRPGIHLRVGLGDPPLLINDVGNPPGVFIARTARCAIREADRLIGVAEKGKREVELLGETGVLRDGIEADAEDLGIL